MDYSSSKITLIQYGTMVINGSKNITSHGARFDIASHGARFDIASHGARFDITSRGSNGQVLQLRLGIWRFVHHQEVI